MNEKALTEEKQATAEAQANGKIPAYPVLRDWEELGLTKRELFAAMAMQGMLANPNHAEFIHSHTERSALAALAADALLKELARG